MCGKTDTVSTETDVYGATLFLSANLTRGHTNQSKAILA
jgi:hypothetical protein